MDIVGNLLPELAQRILLQLDSEDIEIIWNGIEGWKHLFDNLFWKKVCQRNAYQEKEGYLTSDIYKEYMLESSLHWRAIYKYNQLIDAHWSEGNFRFVSIEEDKQYDGIHYFDDELLVVSTVLSDTEVNVDITDLSSGKILFSFTEEKAVRKTVRHRDLLIFLNCKTLKLWNLETKSWFFDVELEETEVFPESVHLEVYKHRLTFIHSRDCLYNVNLETKKVHFKNNSGITDVCFGDNIIILLCKITNKIITLNLDGKVIMKINYRDYHESLEIEDVMVKGGYVIIYYAQVVDENFCKVSVYTIQQDTKKLQEVSSLNMLYRFKCFPNNNTILFCNFISGFRRVMRYTMWKFDTNTDTVSFDNYEMEPLESVVANNCYLFICHINSTLTMWCSETGKYIRIISDKVLKNSQVNFKVTENKLAYLNCDRFLCIQNFDFVESEIDEPGKP